MKITDRTIGVIAVMVGFIGIIIAIIVVPPEDVWRNIKQWTSLFTEINANFLLGIFLGAIISGVIFYFYKVLNKDSLYTCKVFLSSDAFEKKFNALVESDLFNEVKILGYTGETVPDYFKYSHRYKKNLKFKILNRHWIAERNDELIHNERLKGTAIRSWNKSEAIKHAAEKPINFELEIETRYYSSQPSIKAIILSSPSNAQAFLSFYYWEEIPPSGGSPFKGTKLAMIHIEGITDLEKEIIKNLKSQFDYIWQISKRRDG